LPYKSIILIHLLIVIIIASPSSLILLAHYARDLLNAAIHHVLELIPPIQECISQAGNGCLLLLWGEPLIAPRRTPRPTSSFKLLSLLL
jgi:hypothetical protein